MLWVQLVTLLAIIQFFVIGLMVARARSRYGVPAPATTGHELFDRYFRAQMNTLETLVVFLPALWIAAQHWRPEWMAAIGAVYLVGRHFYVHGYVADPHKRHFGYGLSIVPTLLLVLAGLLGIVLKMFSPPVLSLP